MPVQGPICPACYYAMAPDAAEARKLCFNGASHDETEELMDYCHERLRDRFVHEPLDLAWPQSVMYRAMNPKKLEDQDPAYEPTSTWGDE